MQPRALDSQERQLSRKKAKVVMEYAKVALSALFSITVIFIITKLLGNKQLSQLKMFDYVNGITIGSIAAEMATELEEPWKPLTAMAIYGGVTLPNAGSEGLHRALGFQLLGVYRHTGFKCGKWHDVGWFEKALSPCTGNPQPVLPIHRLGEKQRAGILRAFAQPDGQR